MDIFDVGFDNDDERLYRVGRFRNPYGNSALHPGVRTEPCPTCNEPERLTQRDIRTGYQCDQCAELEERAY